MLEFILEVIVYLIVEILFHGIIGGLLRWIKLLGLIILKLLTWSLQPISKLEEKYKDSSKPYFLGFGLVIGIIYWMIK